MSQPTFPRTTLVVIFFLSGVAGLGYEVVWGRWLHSVFGTSAWALAAILSAFMAGLALGSFTAGRLVPRLRIDPLRAYGLVEVLIGAWAFFLPQLLTLAITVQGLFFFRWVEQHTLYGLIRFGLAFAVLLVPTSLMGATFPLLSAYVARYSNAPMRWAGWLYGLNTAGAVLGTFLCGFVLIARFGLVGSNYVLIAINLGVGAVALARSRRTPQAVLSTAPTPRPDGTHSEQSAHPQPAGLYRLVLGVFLVNGLFNLAYEVLWGRALALIIGTTTYALSMMLGVFLAGIAIGSLWMTRHLGNLRDLLQTLRRIQAAMVLWVLVSPLLVNALPFLFLHGLWALGLGWVSALLIKCLLSALLLLPLTLGMGAIFPLGIALAWRRTDGLAREVGDLYGINTAGGIVGALVAGFVIIPVIGVERGLVLTALGHLLCVALLVLASPQGRATLGHRRLQWAVVCLAALILPMVARWNPLILASGVYFQPRLFYDNNGRVRLTQRMSQASLRYHAEGANATGDVLEAPGGFRALTINGKSVATSNYYDYRVQRLLGVLPLLLHPEPRRLLVIGLGTGMTAGTGSIDPTTEHLEIAGEVVAATEHFLPWNLGVVHKPITHVVVEDATHYLRFTDKRYDVITSDPIHPFVSGAGNLYAVESYRVARSKLNPGGIFCQWVPLYQLDDADIDSILRTFDEVWDNATVWLTGKDFILCGAQSTYHIDFQTFAARASTSSYTEILRLLGFWTQQEVLSAYVGRLADLRDQFAGARLNTVDHPSLEFSAPRAIFLVSHAQNLARFLEQTTPAPPTFFAEAPADLARVLLARRPCTELVWRGFIAERRGDLGTATQLARRAYDRCPQLGYVRHFAAHTIAAYAGSIRQTEPARALGLLRRVQALDPYMPDIATAIAALEAGGG